MSRKERRGVGDNIKTNEEQNVKKTTAKKSSTQRKTKQISIFTILLAIVLVSVIIGIVLGTRYLVLTLKYKEYTDKMVWYGYNELYNNQKATATEKLTNGELLKVVIGGISGNKDISTLYYLADSNNGSYMNWYSYSDYLGIKDVISKDKLEDKATVIDSVMFTVQYLESITGLDIEKSELKISKNIINKYSEKERELIAKAITLGIIQNKSNAISTKNIIKGELNKILITLVEKYATIHHDNTIVDESGEIRGQEISIVTDKEKLPSNYEEYPYIIDSIDKEVYEFDYNILTKRNYRSPKETYKIMGYLYDQIDDLLERYFSKILNIDYATITYENFLNSIKNDVVYKLTENDVKEYVDYVKQNKIKLQGKAEPLLPIIYNNGEQYVIRTKLTFNVLNSDTEYNILFGDEKREVKYNSKNITMYVDVPTGMTLNSNSLLVYIDCLARHMTSANAIVVVEK